MALPEDVHAQVATGLEIAPAIIEDAIEPGDTIAKELKVTNTSGNEETFFVEVLDIKGVQNGNQPIFAQDGEKTSFELSSWVTVSEEGVSIGSGETVTIPFVVTVPDQASPGSHFGGLFLTKEPPQLRNTGTGVGFRVGTLLSFRIAGEVIEEARLREFSTNKILFSKPEVDFSMKVQNIGNVLIRPQGLLEIINVLDEDVAQLRVNEEGGAVFPGTNRDFSVRWEGEGIAFGRYQALLSLVYGQEGRKTISGTLSLWILPLNIIVPVAGGLTFFFLMGYLLIRWHIRKRLREMQMLARTSRGRVAVAPQVYYQRQSSRLMVMSITLLIFTVIFLLGLFVFLA